MLHNTGPYGPNETPVNMGAPKIPNLASPMNIAPNFNNFVKMSQQTSHPSSGHFNLQNYVGYAGTTIGSSPQMSMFPNNRYTDIQSNSSTSHSTDYYSNPARHSGSLLENVYNNEDCQKAIDFSNIRHNGSLLESAYNNEDCQKAVDFSNITNSFKVRETPQVHKPTFSIVEMSNFLAPSSNSMDKFSDFNTNYSKSEVISEKNDITKDSNENRYNNVESRVSNAEDNSSDGEYSSNDSYKGDNQNDTSNNLKNTENKQISSEPEDSDEESTNASENEDTLKEAVSKTNDCSEDDKDSDSNDGKPLNLVHFIKQEPSDNEIPKTNVVVKIEQISSWTDTDHMQPFLKDMNGDLRDDSSLRDIVDCDNSIAEAMEIVKNGMTTEVSFECPSCCLIFSHPKRFLIHTKWHSFGLVNEKRVEDAKEKMACRKQKKEMQDMVKKEVAKVKAEEKAAQETFDCKNCDKKFNSKSKLRNHRHKFHPSREHECKVCQKKVLGWFGLQTHMATHGGDAVSGYECQVCHKRFKHSHSLAKHRDTHLEKTHGCAECPKKFGSQTLLKIHMRSHERAQRGRTFRCSYCGKGFYEAYTLQYHERTHRNERPFKCDICETSYGTNSSLKRHIKVSHSQAKPYECETCRRCFATELIRDRHAAREHGTPGQLKYACTHCTSRYLRHKDLQRHMYRIHPKGKKRRKHSESE